MKWDQPPQPGGGEPEYPAPMLALAAGPVASHGHDAPSGAPTAQVTKPPQPKAADNTARLLAGAALVVAALGVGVALIRRRA